MNVRSFVIVPQISVTLLIFIKSSFPLCCSHEIVSVDLSSRSPGHSWTQFQCMWTFLYQQAILIQQHGVQKFNSIVIFLPRDRQHQISQFKGLVPTRLFSTSEASHQLRLLSMPLTDRLKIRGSKDPLQFKLTIASPGCYLYI